MLDLAIRDALIVDGTGAPARPGAIGVAGDRIVALDREVGTARETIDAKGLALAPGIIDGHTHYDAQLTWDAFADPSPALGVTTIIIGNCGFTIAPCRPQDRDLVIRNLTHVEGMSLKALEAGIRWDFESFPEYLDCLEQQGTVPNVGAFFGHSALRTFVMGRDAMTRAASKGEIAEMQVLMREAMAAGAIGFASSTAESHNGEGGMPMPSRLADAREFRALLGAMGGGVFMLTKGANTTIPGLEALAAETGRPVVIAAMFHDTGMPDKVFSELDQVNQARARGHQLVAQVSCCPVIMEFGLISAYVFEDIPAWLPAMQVEAKHLGEVYGEAGFRVRVKADLAERVGTRLFNGDWRRIRVSTAARRENRVFEGKTIAEAAAAANAEPLDWMLDLGLREELETLFTAELKNTDQAAVSRLLRDPDTHVALSDAGAHLTFLCDADFGLHLLGHWSRELGVLSLEEAVRRLTRQPADLFGLPDRGRIALGAKADLLLFDPATVGRGRKRRRHDLPAGAPRLTTEATGVHGVWVNGSRVADESGRTEGDRRPGRLLRPCRAVADGPPMANG